MKTVMMMMMSKLCAHK